MKILIPAFHFDDNFEHNVLETLREMGHDARTLGRTTPGRFFSLAGYARRLAEQTWARHRPTSADRLALKVAREFRPDLVFSTTGAVVHPEILHEMGKTSKRVLWWGDPAANSKGWGVLDEGWDAVFIKDRGVVNKLRLAGRNAHHLHEAMNPRWHRPVAARKNDEVVTAGTSYAYRQAVVLRLAADGVKVGLYGPPPPRWAHPEIKRIHAGRYVVREEKSRVFGEALACLNTFPLSEHNSLNCRAFEVAGAGGLQFIEHRPAVEECFEPGKELMTFLTYEELLGLVEWAGRSPREAEKVREAGARRAHAEHTYRHRIEAILAAL